jgi:hypothetical protein
MKRFGPLVMLLVAIALSSAVPAAYVGNGKPLSDAAQISTSLVFSVGFIIWVVADARTRRQTPCYDFGFLVTVFFPVSLLWYVVWSRGWRGTLMLAALVGLWILPPLCAAVAWELRHGLR